MVKNNKLFFNVRKNLLIILLTVCLSCLIIGFANLQSTYAETVTTSNFSMVNGAQMRKKDPAGLRFATKFDKATYDSLVETKDIEGKQVTKIKDNKVLGMFIVPEFYYEDYEKYLTDNSGSQLNFHDYCVEVKGKIIDFSYEAEQIVNQGEDYFIRGAIVDILFNNTNLNYMATGYIVTLDGENVQSITVADNITSRSLAYVSSGAINSNDTNEYINECSKNAELVEAGVVYNSNLNKYIYQGNEYNTTSEIQLEKSPYELNKTTLTLNIGQTETLLPNTAFGKLPVIWDSDNDQVATVENGIVTAVSPGDANITAKSGNTTITCSVKVNIPEIDLGHIDTLIETADLKPLSLKGKVNDGTSITGMTMNNKDVFGSFDVSDMAVTIDPSKTGIIYGDALNLSFTSENAIYKATARVITRVINDANELHQFPQNATIEGNSTFTDGYFELGNNIDFNQTYYTGVKFGGNSWDAENYGFKGTFDGKGYAIKGIRTQDYVWGNGGFVNTLHTDGVIKNIAFTDVIYGKEGCNGFLAFSANGTIENVYIHAKEMYYAAGSDNNGLITSVGKANLNIKNVYVEIDALLNNPSGKNSAGTTTALGLKGGVYGSISNVYVVGMTDSIHTKPDGLNGLEGCKAYATRAEAITDKTNIDISTWDNTIWTKDSDGLPVFKNK